MRWLKRIFKYFFIFYFLKEKNKQLQSRNLSDSIMIRYYDLLILIFINPNSNEVSLIVNYWFSKSNKVYDFPSASNSVVKSTVRSYYLQY